MLHLPHLITDLGFILIAAAVVTLLCKYLKQPVVLGYLIAGFLVSSHVPFIPTVTETESIKVWAEIGVIFLLFGLGLEFSFKKLVRVGKSASITALVEVVFMVALGYLTGQIFGWSKMDSLFLGGILSISSTTIIVRAFDELNLKGRRFVSLVFGVLIVEDLFAILLLVLLSTVAVTQRLSGTELLASTLHLGFFLALWFIVGIYILPILLKKIRKHLNDESMLLVSIGLCLMMVIIATEVGFSPALGAFVMGSILAETQDGKRVEHLLLPVKDLFAAVFFVSVGMLIDPVVIAKHLDVIIIITLLTIVGKLISTTLGSILSGQSLRHSVQSGMSLAQIGEFSFIIATLGLTLKVTSDFLYPIAVAVSAITTFTTPYLIKYTDPFYNWLEKKIPESLIKQLNRYKSALDTPGSETALQLFWRAYGIKIALNSIVVFGLALAVSKLVYPYLNNLLEQSPLAGLASGLLLLFISMPFLWPIIFGSPHKDLLENPSSVDRLRGIQFGAVVVRLFVAIGLIAFMVSQFTSTLAVTGVVLGLLTLVFIFLSRYTEPFYRYFERQFLLNLTTSNSNGVAKLPLTPWDATLSDIVIPPYSPLVAKSLADSALK